MKLGKVMRVRFSLEQEERLGQMSRELGVTRSDVVRQLIDNATIKPAIVRTEFVQPKGENGVAEKV